MLGRNVEQTRRHVAYTNDNSGFLTFDSDCALISCPLSVKYPLEYFDDTRQNCRTGLDKVSHTRMTTLVVLVLESSHFVLFEIDFLSAL